MGATHLLPTFQFLREKITAGLGGDSSALEGKITILKKKITVKKL